MPRTRTYTEEDLRRSVRRSTSRRQVLIALGLKPQGGNYATVGREIERLGLNTSHFSPVSGHKKNLSFPGAKPLKAYLKKGTTIQSFKLRKRLLREGIFEHLCSQCGRRTWLGQDIPLELDHINGNPEDNRLENLRMLCPNCHAQTPTYRGRNQTRVL